MTAGIRHDDLRRRNRAMVIAAVRRASQPSRTEIAAATGLSHSTISAISADLIAEGILAETKGGEPATAKRGRPQVALALNPDAAAVIVAVLSLNYLSAAIVDYSGGLVAEEHAQAVHDDHAEGRTRRGTRRHAAPPDGGPRGRPAQAAAHRARHPGHHRRRRPHHAVVADHARTGTSRSPTYWSANSRSRRRSRTTAT